MNFGSRMKEFLLKDEWIPVEGLVIGMKDEWIPEEGWKSFCGSMNEFLLKDGWILVEGGMNSCKMMDECLKKDGWKVLQRMNESYKEINHP